MYWKVTSALEPLSTVIPAFSLGEPLVPALSVIMLSSNNNVSVLIVVVVPLTVKLPSITISLLNVLLPPIVCVPEVLTTVASTSIVLELLSIPSPPVM